MKARTKRLLSLFTAIIIAVGTFSVGFSVNATQNMDANYKTGYTLTGNWRDDIVAVANAQYQMTKADFGYTEAWCADFVCACGIIAGIPNFPRNASCDQLIVELKNWGGVWHDYNSSYVPQKGDIVFFSKYGNTSIDSTHVGIIYQDGFVATNTVKTIEGNTSGVTSSCVNIKNREVYGTLPIMGYIELTSVGGTTTPTVTYDSLNPDDYTVPSRTVYYTSPMMTGSDVAWVQAVLYQLGYDIAIDGYFGSASDTVVRQFQADYGLSVDGMAGTNTINKLNELWTDLKTHTHSYTELKSDASTHWYVCSCGEITDVEAHAYSPWSVTSQPTDTTNGEQHRGCTVCGYVQTQSIPATTSKPNTQIVSDGVRKYKPTLDGLLDASYLDSASVTLTGNSDNAVTAYMTWYDDCIYICSVVTDDDITSPGESFFNKTSGLTQDIFFGDTVGYNIGYGGWVGTDANGYALWAFDDTSNTTLAKCTDGDITVNKKYVASTKTADGYVSEICIPITTEGFFVNNFAFDFFIIANDTPVGASYAEDGTSSTRATLTSSGATLKIIDETASADTDNSADYYTANSGNYILKAPEEMGKAGSTLGVDASLDAAYLNSYRQTFTQTQGSNTITMTTYYLWDISYLYIYADVTDPTRFSQAGYVINADGIIENNGYYLPGYEINDVAVFRIFTEDYSSGARIVANATNTQDSGNAYTTAEDGYAIMTDVNNTGIGACNYSYGTNMELDTFTADYPASNTQDYYSSRLKSTGDGYVIELRIPHNIDLFTAGTKLCLSTGAFDVQGNYIYGFGETTWTGNLETAVLSDTAPCQHAWVETSDAPTCGVAGNETFECPDCGEVLATKAIPATEEHVYTGTVTKAATCSATGTMTYTCGVCGDTYTNTIAKLAHTPTTDAAVDATCEGTGFTEGSHCSVCNTVITAQTVVSAIGHNYVGTVTTASTCTENGVMTYVCANDASHTYTEAIEMLEHTPVTDAAVDATCVDTGLTEGSHCSVCKTVIVAQETVPATGVHILGATKNGVKECITCDFVSDLRVGNVSVTLESDLTVNLKIRKDVFDGAGYTDPYLMVTRDGATSRVDLSYDEDTDTYSYYVFELKNFAPRQMGDNFSVVVHAMKDGVEVTGYEVYTSNITTYLAYQFSTAPDTDKGEALKTLIADLLVYGYEHQLYDEYNLDNPVTDVISAEDLAAYATAETPLLENITAGDYSTIENPTATWDNVSLTLKSSIEVNAKFTIDDIEGVTVVFTNDAGSKIDTISTFTASGNLYTAKFTKLKGSQLSDPLYITIYKDGTPISNTLRYSVESYAANYQNDATIGALCVAMMKYGYSAEQYFNME